MASAPEITAIFACADYVTSGVINALQKGLQVPDDISVIGLDHIDLAQEVRLTLTTMRVAGS